MKKLVLFVVWVTLMGANSFAGSAGGEIVCYDTECQGLTNWTDYDAVPPTRQIRCNTANNTCEFRCRTGYYYLQDGSSGAKNIRCGTCPSNASCPAGDFPHCNKDYYRVDAYQSNMGIILSTCEKCPALGGVSGVTASSNAVSISECYIKSNITIIEYPGKHEFVFEHNCHHVNAWEHPDA